MVRGSVWVGICGYDGCLREAIEMIRVGQILRLLIGYFILVGSAMFGAMFNLVTRVGLQ